MRKENWDRLSHYSEFSFLDIHFAGLMSRLGGQNDFALSLGAALASSRTRQGHICLDLSSLAGTSLLENGEEQVIVCPLLDDWIKILEKSPLVGRPGDYKPLILDERARLYLYRYWEYETRLAECIKSRINEDPKGVDLFLLKEGLHRLFPSGQTREIDWQMVGAFAALTRKFCVISGGPGTGKTTTIGKILALFLEQFGSRKPRIALAAPTGKAAARLQEAIREVKSVLDCVENVKEAIPEEASTIHRLLGSIPGSPYFRHDDKNPLAVDVVVIDEASMVDLALMSKLIQAIPSRAWLILLGDKDQLASVEAGAVLGDICDTGNVHRYSKEFCRNLNEVMGDILNEPTQDESHPGMRDCVVQLQRNYRFDSDSGIRAVSRAVNAGDAQLAMKHLSGGYGDILWKRLPSPEHLHGAVKKSAIEGFSGYLRCKSREEIFHRFNEFRILCVVRDGPYGVHAMNALVERIFRRENLIDSRRTWYRGRPVLITSNDYNLKLFNGDVGITLSDPEANNDLRVFFPSPDGPPRKFHPLRLPQHETVYAMTIHKSQGSEFDNILILMPNKDTPLMVRELIYTGITRARKRVELWGTQEIFRKAVSRRIERTSGLRDALWVR